MPGQDASQKLLFSNPEVVRDLIRRYAGKRWARGVDFNTLERVPATFVSDDLRAREDDIIWRVRLKGEWLYVYLLIEFQSSVDWWMALRILVYVGLLYQDLVRTGVVKRHEKLPPVLPIVLYNGKRRWNAATDITSLIAHAPLGLAQYQPQQKYLLLDENRYAGEETDAQNLVSLLFRLENSKTLQEMQPAGEQLLSLLGEAQNEELLRSFLTWFERVLLRGRATRSETVRPRDLLEARTMLAERVREWDRQAERARRKAREEARLAAEKGRQEGEAAVLIRILERRFGSLPDEARRQISLANSDTLLQWTDRVLEAGSLDEILRPQPETVV